MNIKKLKDGGFATIKAVLTASRKQLTNLKGISEIKVEKIKDSASKLSGPSFKTGSDVLIDREKIVTLSTGSKAVDAMLGGGIQSQSITEVYGEFRCGKTQICHTLCVTAQLPTEMGGGGGKAAYIDTEGTFRPERIRTIADRFGMDPEAVLDNIIVGRAANSEHQMELIVHLAAKFAEDGTFRLLRRAFRTTTKVNQMLARLTRISEEFNLCIFLTNQVQADPGAATSTRISLRKGRGDERVAKLCDSPDMPEGEASYKIATGGIEDC
ncbi:hypothetical protein H4Q26_010146 [Puccinia striiformis f. sp. tritici PST-130]|nr:hypothetical protein H4Q26_010146 [Puccinia striiformis f. sp. tritici PST-130]